MLDLNSEWQSLAAERGVTIGDDNNTKIIVDDLFSFCLSEAIVFIYMEAIFDVAARRRLYFSLPKSSFFPTRITFVTSMMENTTISQTRISMNFSRLGPRR